MSCCRNLILLSSVLVTFASVSGLRGGDHGHTKGDAGERILSSPSSSWHTNQEYNLRRMESEPGKIPMFVDDWIRIPNNTVDPFVGEAQGMLMGTDLIITGGFMKNVWHGTNRTTALDLNEPYDDWEWREMAQHPIDFLTHGAHTTKGDNILYICGGYLSAHPGLHLDDCYYFDKSIGEQGMWIAFPSLPEGRAGGAMLYIESMDSLVFTLGATREPSVDHNTTWILDLKDIWAGWSYIGPSPYLGNHVSAITAKDCEGNVRYFVLGGQELEMEWLNNIALVYEYIPESNTFERRADMPEPKGHFTTSIAPYGCGFIIVGGAINKYGGGSTDDILYYGINEDKWTFIGTYPETKKTQVCATYNDELICSTGYINRGYKRKLTFVDAPTTPTIAPSDPPSLGPSDGPTSFSSDMSSSTSFDPDNSESTIIHATFDGSDDGFMYLGGVFHYVPDAHNIYANGMYGDGFGKEGGGGLRLILGGMDDLEVMDMSGGFVTSYTLSEDVIGVRVTFDYLVGFFNQQGEGEDTEVLCSIDGTLYGTSTSTGGLDYIDKYIGLDGTDDDSYPWIWKTAIIDSVGMQSAGTTHTITIGGYRTKKILADMAWTVLLFDNIQVSLIL